MSFGAGDFHPYLPKYLLPTEKQELFEELKKFPNNRAIFTDGVHYGGIMQGDCIRDIRFYESDGSNPTARCVVLSNTCDLSQSNPRIQPMRVVFCPLLLLAKYRDRLERAGVEPAKIKSHLSDVRKQRITNIVYFPENGDLGESMILLDHVISSPFSIFADKPREFRLNTFGFYQFVIKISIHLTRFQEGMDSGNPRTEVSLA